MDRAIGLAPSSSSNEGTPSPEDGGLLRKDCSGGGRKGRGAHHVAIRNALCRLENADAGVHISCVTRNALSCFAGANFAGCCIQPLGTVDRAHGGSVVASTGRIAFRSSTATC